MDVLWARDPGKWGHEGRKPCLRSPCRCSGKAPRAAPQEWTTPPLRATEMLTQNLGGAPKRALHTERLAPSETHLHPIKAVALSLCIFLLIYSCPFRLCSHTDHAWPDSTLRKPSGFPDIRSHGTRSLGSGPEQAALSEVMAFRVTLAGDIYWRLSCI